ALCEGGAGAVPRMTVQLVAALVLAVVPGSLRADSLPDGAAGRLGSTRFLHADWIHSLVFSPDGKTLLAGNQNEAGIIWDVSTGQAVRRFSAGVAGLGAALSPDGTTVATAENGPVIYLMDTATGEITRQLTGAKERSFVLAWSPKGNTIASGDGKSVILWDVANGAIARRLGEGEDFTTALAFSPDGNVLAAANHNKTMRLWDCATGK